MAADLERGTTTAHDRFYVRVLNTSGTLLATLRTRSSPAARGAWYQDALRLSAYAGQTVKPRLQATTDSTLVSSFYVDDVTLNERLAARRWPAPAGGAGHSLPVRP